MRRLDGKEEGGREGGWEGKREGGKVERKEIVQEGGVYYTLVNNIIGKDLLQ